MIARVSGSGQFELPDSSIPELHEYDHRLTEALHARDAQQFHALLAQMIEYVREHGTAVPHDTIVPSSIIIPPEDITLDEAHRFFTDEGLMEPVPA
ncbi:MAG TPA: hypothetical protein VKX16_07215 [Chloroflexota bacterium]|nr:hypothetical protein [Chloroflexota bacterium]